MSTDRAEFILLWVISIACLLYAMPLVGRVSFLDKDPLMQYKGVLSLIQDRDLDVRNQFDFNPIGVSDQSSLGTRGEWYPVHELPLILIGVPFYFFLGKSGLWIFNLLLSLGIALMTFRITLRCATPFTALSTTTLLFLASPLLEYSYSYSVDVLGAFGVLLTFFAITQQRYLFTGFVYGLAVWGRVANVALLPALFCFLLFEQKSASSRWTNFLLFFAGGLPAALAFGISNFNMFGNPLETGYHHNQYFIDGALTTISQGAKWSLDGVRQRSVQIIFDRTLGLFFASPIALIAVIFGAKQYYRQSPTSCLLSIFIMLSFVLFYSAYSGAIQHGGGPRHFLAIFALATPFAGAILNSFLSPDCHKQKNDKQRNLPN